MADRSPSGKIHDRRSQRLRERKLLHEINGLKQAVDGIEIKIMDQEDHIDRLKETIQGTLKQIDLKQTELESLKAKNEAEEEKG
jgi:chromosome segregation ATPase